MPAASARVQTNPPRGSGQPIRTQGSLANGRTVEGANILGRGPWLRRCTWGSALIREFAIPGQTSSIQWWRNAKIDGQAMTSHVQHLWRPSTSENNFLSRNLAEPVADARPCCARAPAHRHVAPRRPRSELLTWQRLRCPKGSCIGERGEGRWWVRPPANSRTSFLKGQKD